MLLQCISLLTLDIHLSYVSFQWRRRSMWLYRLICHSTYSNITGSYPVKDIPSFVKDILPYPCDVDSRCCYNAFHSWLLIFIYHMWASNDAVEVCDSTVLYVIPHIRILQAHILSKIYHHSSKIYYHILVTHFISSSMTSSYHSRSLSPSLSSYFIVCLYTVSFVVLYIVPVCRVTCVRLLWLLLRGNGSVVINNILTLTILRVVPNLFVLIHVSGTLICGPLTPFSFDPYSALKAIVIVLIFMCSDTWRVYQQSTLPTQ